MTCCERWRLRPVLLTVSRCWFVAAGLALPAHAQLTMDVTVPASTPSDATVYVAGTFNDWDPGDPAYALSAQSANLHVITLPDWVRGFVSFKFTLGTWETVEQDAQGVDVPNRFFLIPQTGAATYTGDVASWRDVNVWPLPNSTATPSVSILDFDFPIPQLNRTRRIWLYLPPDYASTAKRYPVLYMQDGQNVFDAATSFAGEWGVDEALDALHVAGDWGVIVVAIANGELDRANEYHPWPHPSFGGGEGDLYLDFLIDTLKPFIDANYRTLANGRNTGIGGSSSAGVISFYAGIREPQAFGRVLGFSPAFFVNPQLYAAALAAVPLVPPSLFTFVSDASETAGGLPPGVFADAQLEMVATLDAAGFAVPQNVRSQVLPDGAHAEWFWRREFPAAYSWLFDSSADVDGDTVPDFADNCSESVNTNQRDTDGDGFGNVCDADLNDDGVINASDLGIFRSVFFSADPDADLDGDGVVAFVDLGLLKLQFFGPPGPSGVSP